MDKEVIKSKLKHSSCKLDRFIIVEKFSNSAETVWLIKTLLKYVFFNTGSYKIFVVSQLRALCKLNCFRTVKKDVNNNKMI
jgi:hypothetical protein